MIEIKFTGMCEDCPCADLEVHCFMTGSINRWVIQCTHHNACVRTKARLEVKE